MTPSISQFREQEKNFFRKHEEKSLSFPVIKVTNIEEKLLEIKNKEGSVVVPKTQMINHGWFAICQEKKGKVFAIFEAN